MLTWNIDTKALRSHSASRKSHSASNCYY